MPSENVYDWSSVASNNGSVDSGIDAYEGVVPSKVNNAQRGAMAALARFLGDTGANFSASGTASAYTASILGTHSTYATGQRLRFKAPIGNSGGATLNVTNANGSALGAKQIRKFTPLGETSLATSNIIASGIYDFMYDASASGGSGAFVVLNPTRVLADVVTQSTGTGSVVLAQAPTINSATINSATMLSPILGKPQSGDLSSCTSLQVSALVGAIYGTFYKASSQSYSSGSGQVKVAIDTADISQGVTFDSVTSNRVTINTAGKYIISYSMYISGVSSADLVTGRIKKNGTTDLIVGLVTAAATGEGAAAGAKALALAQNDFLELYATAQHNGVIQAPSTATFLSLSYVGSA